MPPSYIRVRAVVWAYGRGQTDIHTDRHTDARDHNTFCVVYDSRKMYNKEERRRDKTPAHIINVQSLMASVGESQVVDITPV